MSIASSELLPYSDQCETIPDSEADDTGKVLELLRILLERKQRESGKFQGDVHVKSNGCAQGEFRILPNLPPELAQGLFSKDQLYPAIVRFSNSSSEIQSDWLPDGRGMAIQVLDVNQHTPAGGMIVLDDGPSQTQDFIMINHPVFFARNVHDFLRLEKIIVEAKGNPFVAIRDSLTGGDWNPFNWHWREAITAAHIVTHPPVHPAEQNYFSMAPIRFGRYVAKYRVKPALDPSSSFFELVRKLGQHSDGLRLMLEETLRKQDLFFEFQVQLRTSAETMPIEDATVEWPEQESPFRSVAHLRIPRQEIDRPEMKFLDRQLSFNVWHALAEHRPLGGINRLRKLAYLISSRWRKQQAPI